MISVIIPVYNDPEGIGVTLDSLVTQNPCKCAYEIIVVDNNSTDETPAVIQKYASEHPNTVLSYKETDIQSSYAARNKGIKNANGELLVFIDADMWVEDRFIDDISEFYKQSDAPYIGLDVSLSKGDSVETVAGKYNYLTGFPIQRYLEEYNYAGAGNLVVEKWLFDDLGPFDDQMISNGDKEFGKRVATAGYDQEYCDSIKLYHPVRNSATGMLQKAVRIGRGKIQFSQRHPEFADTGGLTDPRVYLPPHPTRMWELMNGRADVAPHQFAGLYAFGMIYKFARLYGMMLESLKLITD